MYVLYPYPYKFDDDIADMRRSHSWNEETLTLTKVRKIKLHKFTLPMRGSSSFYLMLKCSLSNLSPPYPSSSGHFVLLGHRIWLQLGSVPLPYGLVACHHDIFCISVLDMVTWLGWVMMMRD